MSGTVRIAAWFGILFVGAACSRASAGGDYTAEGIILGPNGEPVTEARVSFYPTYGAVQPHSQLATASDGKYAFSIKAANAEGSYGLIVVQKKGLAWNCRRWFLLGDLAADIRLARPAELAGVVVDEKGGPIAGAAVSLQALRSSDVRSNWLSERLARELFTTTTDSQGRFHFMMLADGWRTDFLIAAPGYATLRTRYLPDALYKVYGPDLGDIRFVLRPEARVRGTVVSESDGKPIPGIDVRIGRTETAVAYGFESVVSDEAGKFSLKGLPEGDFWLGVATSRAPDTGWVGWPIEIPTKAGETTSDVKLELTQGGMLEARVLDEQDAPVEDAPMTVFGREGSRLAQGWTDAEGLCRLRLPAGAYKLVDVGKAGYHSHEPYLFFDIEKDQTTRREVTLKKADRIEGLVVDADGQPVSSVRVTLMPSPVSAVVTDKRGRFTMIWDKWSRAYESYGQTQFELVARDRAGGRATTLTLQEPTKTLRLVLQPAVTMTGTVVDDEGEPVERALVSSWLKGRMWGMNLSANKRILTDRSGRFRVGCVPPERTCEIAVRAGGYDQVKQEIQTPSETDRPFDIGTIKLVPKSASDS